MGLIDRSDGMVQQTDADAPQLQAAGYIRCYNNRWKKRKVNGNPVWVPCPFWISPEGQERVKDTMAGYYTCPVCSHSYDLLSELPWHGVSPDEAEANQREDQQAHNFSAGGGTRIGLTMKEQAQIGEDLIESQGELPGYGPITWWHQGGATSPSPLDGATQDWGIEVKTIGYDAIHHRFVPGRPKEKEDKNGQAAQMGKKGVLGILVLLDYKRSMADVYVKEMPLGGGVKPVGGGVTSTGVAAFRSTGGLHLLEQIPFKNPLMDPHSPSPVVQTGHSAFADGTPLDDEGNEMAF